MTIRGGLPAGARDAILAWYDTHGRRFAFRETDDPYAVLVSETMAQQTQIARAAERWVRWLVRWPTVEAVAEASPADVLREWRGLGYNRRALNLWRAARAIVAEHDGRVPDEVAALERLPGVGPYTARAVAAIAFGRPVGAVDTNVRRVLGRLTGVAAPDVQATADASVPADRPADWTHAVMDLGATVCRAARPRCDACPVSAWCAWDGSPLPPARGAGGEPPFRTTSRWLRGRLLDLLRDAGGGGGGWVALPASIGSHDAGAVDRALAGLAADGLVERDPSDPARCRLPLA